MSGCGCLGGAREKGERRHTAFFFSQRRNEVLQTCFSFFMFLQPAQPGQPSPFQQSVQGFFAFRPCLSAFWTGWRWRGGQRPQGGPAGRGPGGGTTAAAGEVPPRRHRPRLRQGRPAQDQVEVGDARTAMTTMTDVGDGKPDDGAGGGDHRATRAAWVNHGCGRQQLCPARPVAGRQHAGHHACRDQWPTPHTGVQAGPANRGHERAWEGRGHGRRRGRRPGGRVREGRPFNRPRRDVEARGGTGEGSRRHTQCG